MSKPFFRVHEKDVRKTPMVRIDWRDASAYSGWHEADGSDARVDHGCMLTRITSCGFIVRETRRELVLATNISTCRSKVADLMVIPRKWVDRVTRLAERSGPRKIKSRSKR